MGDCEKSKRVSAQERLDALAEQMEDSASDPITIFGGIPLEEATPRQLRAVIWSMVGGPGPRMR